MAWYTLSGRHVTWRIGEWATANFLNNEPVKDVMYGLALGSLPTGVTALSPVCFLNEVSFDTYTAGITPIIAIGVENIAALQETLLDAQTVRTVFTIQSMRAGATDLSAEPINFVKKLLSGSTRLTAYVGTGVAHLPPFYLEFLVFDPAGTGNQPITWRIAAPYAWAQRTTVNVARDGARLEINWTIPYITIDKYVNQSPPSVLNYLPEAGILTTREGAVSFTTIAGDEAGDPFDVTSLVRTITDLRVEINNTLNPIYTLSTTSDFATGGDAVRRSLRAFNTLFEGRSEVRGSLTIVYPSFLRSLNLAFPQVLRDMTVQFYEAAGTGNNTTTTPTAVLWIKLQRVKIMDSRVALRQEDTVNFAVNFQALDIDLNTGAAP